MGMSTDELEQQLSKLKVQSENMQRARARYEVEKDTAKQSVEKALGILQEEFEVKTLAEARELLETSKSDLTEKINEVKNILGSV